MDSISSKIRSVGRMARDDSGVAAIEYAFLIALIALSILLSLGSVGNGVASRYNQIDTAVGDAGTTFNR